MSDHLLSLAAGVLPEFPPDHIVAAAAAAGYPASGIWFDAETWTDATTRNVAQRLRDGGLVALDIEVIWIRSGRKPAESARRLIAAGGELGARNVLIVSANADEVETRHQFAALCELAERAGMRAVLEFLMISPVRTLEQALSVIRDVGHRNGAVLIDALHLQRCGAAPEDLIDVDPAQFPYAQLCDGPATLPAADHQTYLEDAVDGRSAAGEGGLPLHRLLEVLPAGLPLSLEVRSRRYRDAYPNAVDRARAVLQQTQRFLESHYAP